MLRLRGATRELDQGQVCLCGRIASGRTIFMSKPKSSRLRVQYLGSARSYLWGLVSEDRFI
jgi:hypothetical protein